MISPVDACVRAFICSWAGQSLSPAALDQATLPQRYGGLGLPLLDAKENRPVTLDSAAVGHYKIKTKKTLKSTIAIFKNTKKNTKRYYI